MANSNQTQATSSRFYIMANITDKYVCDRIDERRKTLLNGNLPSNNILHITLLEFIINKKNPNSFIFENQEFITKIGKFYEETFRNEKVKLIYELGSYDLMGKTKKKFYVKKYHLEENKTNIITSFRKKIYKYLEERLGGEWIISNKIIGSDSFKSFSYNGEELFSVPIYYYGVGVWTPHISLVNTDDLKTYNEELFEVYNILNDKEKQINLLLDPILKKNFKPIGNIDMNRHVKCLNVSIKDKNGVTNNYI